jgi:NDP-sugar pyrophosphorylase family protein
MQALILAGGKGTRLRPLTVYTPKPIVPVANRPLLRYQIDILKDAGISDITLSLSYQPDKIEHVIGNGGEEGVTISYITEPSPLGTAGAYRNGIDRAVGTTVVFNGDILTDLDVKSVIDFHKRSGAVATLTLAPVDDPTVYGLVETDKDGQIKSFVEKPSAQDALRLGINTINAGIYVLEPEVWDLIPAGTNSSFEYDIFPQILEKKMPFYGYVIEHSYWRDIGTPASYLAAHHDLLSGKISGFADLDRDSAEIATRAELDRTSVIGPGSVIKPGAVITNSVIGAGVHIEEKAVIRDSVVWSHTRIAAAAEIDNAVIGRSCHIGRNAVVGAGSVLGDKTSLTDYTKV